MAKYVLWFLLLPVVVGALAMESFWPSTPVALGLESGVIPDSSIISSDYCSKTSNKNPPSHARLNAKTNNGRAAGWIPDVSDFGEWLQIDFGSIVNVVKFATQGSAGAQKWVSSCIFSFSVDGVEFTSYKEKGKIKIFAGNQDSTAIVTNKLDTMVATRYVRCHPLTWNGRIGLRMEFYGYKQKTTNPGPVPVLPPPPECQNSMDLGIIIDSSASIPAKEFETAKEFVATLVRPLPVSPTQTRVGLMTYNAYTTVILRFTNKMYQNVAAVERIINSISYQPGWTRTDKALLTADKVLLKPGPYYRVNTPKVLIVMTDGRTNFGSLPYSQVLRPLQRKGVRIVAVGVGPDVNYEELLTIAGGVKQNVIPVRDFNDLFNNVNSILAASCGGNMKQ